MKNLKIDLMPYEKINTFSLDIIPNGVSMIKAPEFWTDETTKGSNIKIAILDTGCDINHPDLKNRIKGVRNFTPDDLGRKIMVTDNVGHGTHVAGIIAASSDDSGIVGVAPNVDLYILKVLTSSGGTIEWLVNALEYCRYLGVDIINMSLGTSYNSPFLYEAIKKAVLSGISLVCAAGNSGDGSSSTNEISYPAGYNECIAVGAVDSNMEPSDFTNSNNNIDLVAPGVSITSTYPGNLYANMSGTSQAAPHVSGALALIKKWSKDKFNRNLSEIELYSQLIRKTLDLNASANMIGNGMIYLTADKELKNLIFP